MCLKKLKKKKKRRKYSALKLLIVELDSHFGSSRDPVMGSFDKPRVCHTTDFKSPFPDRIFLARVSFILLKGLGYLCKAARMLAKRQLFCLSLNQTLAFAET